MTSSSEPRPGGVTLSRLTGRQLWQVLQLFRPYLLRLIMLAAATGLVAALNGASQVALTPLLEIVLNTQRAVSATASFTGDLNDMGVSLLTFMRNMSGTDEPWMLLIITSITYLALIIAQQGGSLLTQLLATRLRLRIYNGLLNKLFTHILYLPLSFIKAHPVGWVQSRVTMDVERSTKLINDLVIVGLSNLLLSAFYIFILLRTNPWLTLVAALAGALQLGLSRLLSGLARERTRADLDMLARVNTFLQERLSALREVKSISAESYESTQMFQHTEEQRKVYVLVDAYQRFTPPIRMVTNQLVLVGVMLFGAWQLLQGQISSSAFLLFMFFAQQLIQPLTQVADLFLRVTELSVMLEGSVYILGQRRENKGTKPIPPEGFQKALVLERISFAYENVDVLRNITLTINTGEMIALVGRSGAGKSTLVDLLLRFYEPDSGTFTLDGTPVSEFKLTDYRRMFGVVSQENILFNDTVYNNIAYARSWLTEEQVRHAAQVANAEPFILDDLEDGYQTVLGERGTRLSGGQRQRIAIARAVVHHPQILVLVEATSALDSESERLVQKAIDRVIEGNTAIVIAHRLSTILRADKIVVMKDGAIVEIGTHAELIQQNGEYRYLYDLQFSHTHTTPTGHPV